MFSSVSVDSMIRAEIEAVRIAQNPFAEGVLIEARSVVAQGGVDLDTEITEENLDDVIKKMTEFAGNVDVELSEDDVSDESEKPEKPAKTEKSEPSPEVESSAIDPLDVASRAVDMVLEILKTPSTRVASAVADVVLATELIESKSSEKSKQWFRSLSDEAQKSFCERSPDSELCGGNGAGKKQKSEKPSKQQKTPEEQPQQAPEPVSQDGIHPSQLGDGPFDFESRKEKPLSEKQHKKIMDGGGVALILSQMRNEFQRAGQGAIFDKRIGQGVLSQGDVTSIQKAVMDSSEGNKYDPEKALKAVTAYLFKPAGDAQKPTKKKPVKEAPVEKTETPIKESPSEKTETPTEKAPEKKEEPKKTESPYGDAKSQGQHELVSKDNPLNFSDKDGMKSRGFREPKPGSPNLSDESVLINPNSGEKFRFGDLPKQTQEKIRQIVEKKGAWLAPKKQSEPKKEEKPEEPKSEKPEEKPESSAGDVLSETKSKSVGKSLAKSVAKSIGKNVGGFAKAVKKFIKKTDAAFIKKYVGTKKTVRELLRDVIDSAKESYADSEAKTSSVKTASVVDELVVAMIADRIVLAARGLQVRRKDKDLMRDTGGTSKNRPRQPLDKPPRDDLRNRLSPKRKPSSDKDKDTDLNPDKKAGEEDDNEEAMILM